MVGGRYLGRGDQDQAVPHRYADVVIHHPKHLPLAQSTHDLNIEHGTTGAEPHRHEVSVADARLGSVPALTLLDREMYTEPQAARLLRLAPSTHDWLEGGTRRNKTYKPVIRAETTGSNR